jgi:ferric-dicitrate binding protein FerR (iron transport regulator)
MKNRIPQDKNLIWKLISGQLPRSEEVSLYARIENSEELIKHYRELKNAWALSASQSAFSDQEIDDKLHAFKKHYLPHTNHRFRMSSIFKYAAVFVLTFGLSWLLFNSVKQEPTPGNAFSPLVFETGFGQTAKAVLPDGSAVWLNGNSRLELLKSNTKPTDRLVRLQGEAYFEVAKDSLHPFLVSTPQGPEIKVLGTSFNIDAYTHNKVVATLMEGSVELLNEKSRLALLEPGDQVTYNTDTESLDITKIKLSLIHI